MGLNSILNSKNLPEAGHFLALDGRFITFNNGTVLEVNHMYKALENTGFW